MTQSLSPTDGGVVLDVQTTTVPQRLNVLSEQFIQVNNLQSRPTEWAPGGRPIYRRLPGSSERYQINFFNYVVESNVLSSNRTLEGIEKVGYVYTPYGESINGPTSVEVIPSDTNRTILVKAGTILWEYGKTEVLPSLIDLSVLDVLSGKYTLAYQLIYDDSPVPKLYEVSDYSLEGVPMTVTSSTDSIVGWRFSPVNAFITSSARSWSNEDSYFPLYAQPTEASWSNEDSYFPLYAQPTEAYLQWETEYAQAYTKLTLRCPVGTSYSGTATLSYVESTGLVPVETVSVSSDTQGQFFEFTPDSPAYSTGWHVSFSSVTVSVESVLVSGSLTLLEPQAAPSPRTTLVMYSANAVPKTVTNTLGETVPATYCLLADVDVNSNYEVTQVTDLRTIIHRNYEPVADWLTKPFDLDLIDLYEQVSNYASLWMSPPDCLKQEYAGLAKYQVQVEE